MTVIMTIDGVVAVGKSTMCKVIHESLKSLDIDTQYLPESYDADLLCMYIEDPKTHIEKWTRDITARKISVYKAAETYKGVSIIDRSYVGDLAISLMRLKNGEMPQWLYDWQVEQFECLKDICVDIKYLLTCEPEEAMSRCRSRSRNGECHYDLDYFSSQSDCHHELISSTLEEWKIIKVPDRLRQFNI